MAPNQWYEAYERSFGTLWCAARARNVTINSMAQELGRLLQQHPTELGPAVRLALADALGRQPRRSREHVQRFLLGPTPPAPAPPSSTGRRGGTAS